MSPAALGQLIVAAVGIAISPVSIAAVILLLISPRAKATSAAFLLGWTLGIVASVTVFTLLAAVVPLRLPGPAHTALGFIQLAVGVLLLVLALIQWRRRSSSGDAATRTPAWMGAIDRATPAITFGAGFVMAMNPPNLLLALTGGVALGASGVAGGQIIAPIAVFTLIAASTVLVPVVACFVAPDGLRGPLTTLREWLARHSSAILITVFAVLGVLSVGQGVAALSAG